MKDTTKEFAKDCGNVAIEGAKYLATSSIIGMGSTMAVTEGLAIAYALGCQILRCTPEGKALEIAAKVIMYSGIFGGGALGAYIDCKLGVGDKFFDAFEDVTNKYSKKDSVVTVKFDWKPVMPE